MFDVCNSNVSVYSSDWKTFYNKKNPHFMSFMSFTLFFLPVKIFTTCCECGGQGQEALEPQAEGAEGQDHPGSCSQGGLQENK